MKYHPHLIHEIHRVLIDIMNKSLYADKAIEKAFKAHPKWGSRDRKFFAETVYDSLRWWRKLWFLAGLPDEDYLTGVNEATVGRVMGALLLEKKLPCPTGIPNMNEKIILQNHLLFSEKLQEFRRDKTHLEIRESISDWMNQKGQQELGADWEPTISALNRMASVFLRANLLKTTREQLQKKLLEEDVETLSVKDVPDALQTKERRNVFITKAFKEGLFEVQDAASQLIAPLLNPQPGERIIDACAGAGGKSLHLSSLMQNKGKIISLDIHAWKLEELKVRARRNGVSIIETRVIESSKVIKRLEGQADGLLLDVPCSGMGVLRRNPDSKWKLNEDEVQRLRQVQQDILGSYQKMVKPGGRMVYATCSLLPSENEEQVQEFLKKFPDWELVQEIHFNPAHEGFDGFYGAHLKSLKK